MPDKKIKIPGKKLTRRTALKSIGGSAVAVAAADKLPGQWKRPVIDAVAIPAHAAMTTATTTTSAPTTPAASTPVPTTAEP